MKSQKRFFSHVVDYVFVKAILVSLVVLLSNTAQAQHEADNWIFGNRARIDFSSGSPVAVTLTSTPLFNTQEGSSSISDQSGHLLFYTDGKTIWNRNNAAMPNGSGLMGDSSSTQSALIVPWPGSGCNKYYVFTVDAQENVTNQTLRYSVVDMSLAGGFGDIATPIGSNKNIQLKVRVAEKLAAVRDAAGSGFWVVAHGYDKPTSQANGEFYAYHITSTGLNTTPVISSAGSPHDSAAVTTKVPSSGQMKISPDGQLIACAVNAGFVEILNFNSITGAVTQGPPRFFPSVGSSSQFNGPSMYGLEFSPNSKVLYVTTTFSTPSKLFQLDLTSSTATWNPIATAAVTRDMAELQLGPDNKIYVARETNSSWVGVINSPNSLGTAAGYVANGVALPTGSNSRLGLPTMIGGNFSCAPCGVISEPRVTCDRGIFTYTFTVTNSSTQTIQYLLLSPPIGATFTISPNVINLGTSPLGPGQSTTVTVTITNATPGDHICFSVALADRDVVPCCTIQTCVDLPSCPCLRLLDTTLACGANGIYTYTVPFQNLTNVAINQVFIVPTQPSNLNISPQLVTLATPLQPGNTTTLTITITGAPPGTNVCLRFTPLGDDGATCCSVERCFRLDCHP